MFLIRGVTQKCVYAEVCVCVSLVCHSELCPYVTKHNHVLFILEREREKEANSHCQGDGVKDGRREKMERKKKIG